MPRGMSRPHLDPDAWANLSIGVEQLAPAIFHAFLDGGDGRPSTVLLRHLARLLERGLLHVDGGVREARGAQRPADVVGVQVREDDVGYVLGGVSRPAEMVEKIVVSPQLVASDQDLGQLRPEPGIDEHEVIAGLDQDGVHGTFDAGLPRASKEVARVGNEYPIVEDVDPHLSYV